MHLGNHGGVALRVQGLRRYYAVRLTREGYLQVVRVRDDESRVLAEREFPFEFERELSFAVRVQGHSIGGSVNGVSISAEDRDGKALRSGAVGLFINEGALTAGSMRIVGP